MGDVRRERGLVTTPLRRTEAMTARAEVVGDWFRVPYRDRNSRSVAQVFQDEDVEVLIVADTRLRLYHRTQPETPVFFHPGMAMQRIRGIRRGGRDRMIEVAGIRPGDSVLDATLGHGADSLVAAYVVGDGGTVVGVDASWYMTQLLTWTQRAMENEFTEVEETLRRIQMKWGNHTDFMRECADNSVDVVLFDPMFRLPPKHPTDIEPGRPLTRPDRLSTEAFVEAQRIARRAVVVKERPGFGELERFNLVPDKRNARFAYGVWKKGN